jgi:hypothetical protein
MPVTAHAVSGPPRGHRGAILAKASGTPAGAVPAGPGRGAVGFADAPATGTADGAGHEPTGRIHPPSAHPQEQP